MDLINQNDKKKDDEGNELQQLEIELNKLSNMFFTSLDNIRRYGPFIPQEGEINMEESELNKKRIEFEGIQNYEETRQNFDKLIENNAKEVNDIFNNVNTLIDDLGKKEEFKSDNGVLKKQLDQLRKINEKKSKTIKDKILAIEQETKNLEMMASLGLAEEEQNRINTQRQREREKVDYNNILDQD